MGYYTRYNLAYEISSEKTKTYPSEKEIINVLANINPGYFEENADFEESFSEEMKWYDHEEDMLELSKRMPGILFTLEGEGEERDDNWIKYFENGKVTVYRGIIVYEPE